MEPQYGAYARLALALDVCWTDLGITRGAPPPGAWTESEDRAMLIGQVAGGELRADLGADYCLVHTCSLAHRPATALATPF